MQPENLRRKIAALEQNPSAGLAYSDARVVEDDLSVRHEGWFTPTLPNEDKIFAGREFFEKLVSGDNLVCCPSAVFRRSVFEQLGRFDPQLPYTADWEMWLRMAMQFDVAYLKEPLVLYRVHDKQRDASVQGIEGTGAELSRQNVGADPRREEFARRRSHQKARRARNRRKSVGGHAQRRAGALGEGFKGVAGLCRRSAPGEPGTSDLSRRERLVSGRAGWLRRIAGRRRPGGRLERNGGATIRAGETIWHRRPARPGAADIGAPRDSQARVRPRLVRAGSRADGARDNWRPPKNHGPSSSRKSQRTGSNLFTRSPCAARFATNRGARRRRWPILPGPPNCALHEGCPDLACEVDQWMTLTLKGEPLSQKSKVTRGPA